MEDKKYNDEVTKILSENLKVVLEQIGEDPDREGLQKTPERVAKAMQFLTHGYDLDPREILNQAIFHEEYSEMVIVKDIEVYSLCEHHMLPFFGKAHVAYIPDGKIVGLSKIPRVVDASLISIVKRSCTCNRLENASTTRGILLSPTIFPSGI